MTAPRIAGASKPTPPESRERQVYAAIAARLRRQVTAERSVALQRASLDRGVHKEAPR